MKCTKLLITVMALTFVSILSNSSYGQYVRNNPINYIDPYGLFRFGTRDLGNTFPGSRYSGLILAGPVGTGILNMTNLGTYHEHGFFEDGSYENIGYFKPNRDGTGGGVISQKNSNGEHPRNYDVSPWQYDDNIMRRAIKNVTSAGNFDPQDYSFLRNNCQDYASALRREYKRLGGKVKFRPSCKK